LDAHLLDRQDDIEAIVNATIQNRETALRKKWVAKKNVNLRVPNDDWLTGTSTMAISRWSDSSTRPSLSGSTLDADDAGYHDAQELRAEAQHGSEISPEAMQKEKPREMLNEELLADIPMQ
jgi:hypothetical protein